MVDNDDEVPGIAASPRHVRRARLHDLLDGVTGHRCVLVTGPAGAGKTELIRAWSAEQPAVTFHDLADHQPALRPTGAPGGAPSGAPIPAVFDNVHLAGEPQLNDIVGMLAAAAGAGMVLAGRWMPPRLRACLPPGSTVEVDGSALALTEDETARLCANHGPGLSPEILSDVFAVTGGWAAGAVIAATSMAGDPVGKQHHLHELHAVGASLHDYVVEDVLAHLSDEDRRAVIDTSAVEAVCAALFTALTGRRDAAHLLRHLACDGMFAIPVGTRGWYRYRQLWRTALYIHMQHFEPARLCLLHRKASDWYAAQGRYREAVHHATAAGDHAGAVDLAARHHFDITACGPQVTMALPPSPSWTGPNPGPGRPARHATPAVGSGVAQQRATPEKLHDARTSSAGRRVAELAEPAVAALNADRPLQARAYITEWLAAAQELGPLPHARALRHSACTEMRLGNLQLAASQATRTRQLLADHGVVDAHDDGWARIVLAGVHIQRHELTAAAEQLRGLAVDLCHADAPLTAAERLHRAMIEQQRGSIRAALATTHQLIQTDAPPADTIYLHIQLVLASDHSNDAERYATTLAAQVTGPLRRLIDADLLLTQGHAAQATTSLQPFLQHPGTSTLHRIDALLLLAEAAAHVDHIERATDLRRQAHQIAAPAGILRPFLLNKARDNVRRRPTPHTAPAPPPTANLTASELAVLQLLDSLLTVAEIAERLHLTDNTVKTHISRIYRKLDVHRRRDAVHLAHKLHLL